MKKKKSNYKKYKFTYIKTTLITLFFSLFFLNGYVSFEKTGDNFFHIFLFSFLKVCFTFQPKLSFVKNYTICSY